MNLDQPEYMAMLRRRLIGKTISDVEPVQMNYCHGESLFSRPGEDTYSEANGYQITFTDGTRVLTQASYSDSWVHLLFEDGAEDGANLAGRAAGVEEPSIVVPRNVVAKAIRPSGYYWVRLNAPDSFDYIAAWSGTGWTLWVGVGLFVFQDRCDGGLLDAHFKEIGPWIVDQKTVAVLAEAWQKASIVPNVKIESRGEQSR